MGHPGQPRPRKLPSGPIFRLGLSALALGGLLLIAALASGSPSNATLRQVIFALRETAPVLLMAGAALAVLGFAMRRRGEEVAESAPEPTWFDKDTTDFFAGPEAPESVVEPDAAYRGRRPPAQRWSAHVFEDIEWRRFEAVCADLFSQDGLDARGGSLGPEGAADLWLHSDRTEGIVGVVRCVHWARQVQVEDVRAFRDAIAARKLQRNIFATTSTFTPDARQFARANGISPLDGQALLALIATRTQTQQLDLLMRAYDGEYWRPTCASCGQKMVERSGRRQSRPFWSCADYPRCKFTLAGRTAA